MASRAIWAGLLGAAILAGALSGCGGRDEDEAPARNVQADAPKPLPANVVAPTNTVDPDEAARRAQAAAARHTSLSAQEEALSTAPAPYEGDSNAATSLPPQTDDAPPSPPSQPNATGPRS